MIVDAVERIELSRQVAEALKGQATNDLRDVLKEIGRPELENSVSFCMDVDAQVFKCEACGWWCDEEEKSGGTGSGWVCEECCPEGADDWFGDDDEDDGE